MRNKAAGTRAEIHRADREGRVGFGLRARAPRAAGCSLRGTPLGGREKQSDAAVAQKQDGGHMRWWAGPHRARAREESALTGAPTGQDGVGYWCIWCDRCFLLRPGGCPHPNMSRGEGQPLAIYMLWEAGYCAGCCVGWAKAGPESWAWSCLAARVPRHSLDAATAGSQSAFLTWTSPAVA